MFKFSLSSFAFISFSSSVFLAFKAAANLASNSFSFALKASKCALYCALLASISLSNSRLAAAIFCFISSSSSVFRAKFTSTSAPQLPHFTLLCIYSLVFIFSNSSCTVAEFGSLLILSIASP